MKGVLAALLVTLQVAYVVGRPSHTMSCSEVDLCVAPCVRYLTREQKEPSEDCCKGVKRLKGMPKNTEERRFACSCVKQAAHGISGLKDDAVMKLPTACDTPLLFSISMDFDCNSIP
ncbi:hypothetical protein LUZ61_017899 [Rhynchospora tenuis]|uniref:Bifunctional inhibitor/plant lipid transfer protein/seed storage helical domain-containing protein n=1 Tax=Rhynchospora tenuis TaxID=198213 RepID=A0AAD5Z869_9POAL|nr:hypothetical protein LUZ61_017899 [Rhynchospora tenuis]